MRVHFIAIGGAVMHNMAIALHKKGYEVSGSDDEIFDPAKSRLSKQGLLPAEIGWDADRIHTGLDAVILGMHAKKDNPELLKAKELDLPVYSFPEFVFEQSKHKRRVVVAGSHGKTTITAMIMHALKKAGVQFDYVVGSALSGFEDSVSLNDKHDLIIIEGDEYLTSPLDRRPKFMWYKPQVLLISGIAWDHINVFPTYEGYVEQFQKLVDSMNEGVLVFNTLDKELDTIVARQFKPELQFRPYRTPQYKIGDGVILIHEGNEYSLSVFGKHNLENLEGARMICEELDIEADKFYKSMADFTGAGRRLELWKKDSELTVIRDFAHSPSKVKASSEAVAEAYDKQEVLAVLELHTFSSLNKDFLKEYSGALDSIKNAVVYVNPEVVAQKGLMAISKEELITGFNKSDLQIVFDSKELKSLLSDKESGVLLLMSSGNFNNLDLSKYKDA